MSEAEWQKRVCEIAEAAGWEWVHFRSERTRPRQAPIIVGTMRKGWPDLLLGRLDERPIVAELKAEGKEPDEDQWRVLHLLAGFGFAVYVWQPSDEDVVRSILA